jgi:hypothetical protein
MSYSNFLVSKGVSRSGAAEVVLGQPLTLASDRVILGKLALPSAAPSLRRGSDRPLLTAPRQASTMLSNPGFLASLTIGEEASWSFLLAMLSQLTSNSSSVATQDRINKLKAQIDAIKAQLKPLIAQVQFLLSHPPPIGSPDPAWSAWSANINQLRRMIERLEVTMKAILAELDALRS